MKEPLVSVVVPAFNSAEFIAGTLTSVYEQTYKNMQVIVVDDGSTDETAKLVGATDATCIYQQNAGAPAARNRGLQECRGEYIAFLDSDDVWLPTKIERQLVFLQNNRADGFVVCRMRAVLAPGMVWPPSLRSAHYDTQPPAYLPSGMLVRREVFGQIGNFDEAIPTGDDSDWLFRAKDAGIEHGVLQEVLLEKTIRPGSISSDVEETQSSLLMQIRQSVARKRALAIESK